MKDTVRLIEGVRSKFQPPTTLLARFLKGEELTRAELEILIFVLYLESLSNKRGLAELARLAIEEFTTGKATMNDAEIRHKWANRMKKALNDHETFLDHILDPQQKDGNEFTHKHHKKKNREAK